MDVAFCIDATKSMRATLQVARDKVADLAFDLRMENKGVSFSYACVCYRDPVDEPTDVHEIFDFNESAEEMATWLDGVKPIGGGDGPEDYVGAMDLLEGLSWRKGSKRCIIWIADAPAHGKLYCGIENHQEEEGKLEPLVAEFARRGYHFTALSLHDSAKRTFDQMKKIYEAKKGEKGSFMIEKLVLEPGCELELLLRSIKDVTKTVTGKALHEGWT